METVTISKEIFSKILTDAEVLMKDIENALDIKVKQRMSDIEKNRAEGKSEKELDKLDTKDLEIFYKKKEKIKQNPSRLKHLSGGENCYREEITQNIRLVYYIKGNVIWLLTIDKHDDAYTNFR